MKLFANTLHLTSVMSRRQSFLYWVNTGPGWHVQLICFLLTNEDSTFSGHWYKLHLLDPWIRKLHDFYYYMHYIKLNLLKTNGQHVIYKDYIIKLPNTCLQIYHNMLNASFIFSNTVDIQLHSVAQQFFNYHPSSYFIVCLYTGSVEHQHSLLHCQGAKVMQNRKHNRCPKSLV